MAYSKHDFQDGQILYAESLNDIDNELVRLDETKLDNTSIVDNLVSTDISKSLSANQGKVLNDTKINKTDIQDNLTSTDKNKPLSANQGKVLNEKKINYTDIKDNLISTDVDKPLSANQGKVLKENFDNYYNKSEVDQLVVDTQGIYYGNGAESTYVPLNADLLQGHNASYFATKSELNASVAELNASVAELQATRILPEIIVKTKQEETLTCSCGSTVLTGTTVDNTYIFKVPFYATWVIKDSTEKLTQTVEVNAVKQYEAHIGYILGIKKDKTAESTKWERTDDSVGLNATASIGSTKGQSDFDNIDIYKEIYRYTKDTGDVVVRVPKFYYKRYYEGNNEFIKIANKQFDGFKVHPAFKKGDTEVDYFEVGAYKTTAGHFSKSGLAPLVNITRATFRTNAQAKGTGWGIIDIATVSAIQMLILVEYADNNSQSVIGSGNCSTNAAIVTGTTDSMYNEGNHTGRASGTDTAVNCIWRGIESFWGNVWEFTDGLNYNNGKYLICNKPQYYADDTDNQYTELAYTLPTGLNNTFIKELGYDASEDWCMMPTATGGDANTYITDAVWSNTGWRILLRGGSWDNVSSVGLFASSVWEVSSFAYASFGSRLLFLPL